jgi:hypothetical protein
MNVSNLITILGVSILLFYSVVTILKFYGINESVYGIYLLFYIFIVVSMIVLPTEYPKIL